MIVTKLMGGLGNQMFQYAAAKSISLKNNTELFLDLNFLLDRTPHENFTFRDFDLSIFNATYKIADKALTEHFLGSDNSFKNIAIKVKKKISNKNFYYYHEPFFHFNPDFYQLKDNYYLEGYFQSEKYFSDNASIIRNDFIIQHPISKKTQSLLSEIQADNNSVCLNVRRGDFVSNPLMAAEHGLLGLDYYHSAVHELMQIEKNITLYIFSDDVEWCANNLKFDVPAIFIDHTYAGEKFSTYLLLMKTCHHFIIPNSTFGWWAAWLGDYSDKIVIAPKNWFKDKSRNTKDVLPALWRKL